MAFFLALLHVCQYDMRGASLIVSESSGVRLHCQTKGNEFFTALKQCVGWLITDGMPLTVALNPYRVIATRRYSHVMDNYLKPLIKQAMDAEVPGDQAVSRKRKTVVSLAANSFTAESKYTAENDKRECILKSEAFIHQVANHIKIFMFAGHDTTATTLSYAYYRIYRTPGVLAKLRAEHDSMLGPDLPQARDRISADPQLLNAMPYTSAVVRETLRLYPPVGTVRDGQEGFYLTHPETGQRYPTQGMMLYGCSFSSHRMMEFWPRADEFVPERWLAREGEGLHVRKNAFRPFELGPRNCIGQELAHLELRAILAVTVREFDMEDLYSECAPTVLGDPCYQCKVPGDLTAHPKDGMPMKVKRCK